MRKLCNAGRELGYMVLVLGSITVMLYVAGTLADVIRGLF